MKIETMPILETKYLKPTNAFRKSWRTCKNKSKSWSEFHLVLKCSFIKVLCDANEKNLLHCNYFIIIKKIYS